MAHRQTTLQTPRAVPAPLLLGVNALGADTLATSKVGDCVYTKDGSGAAPARDVAMPPSAPTVNTRPATMTINTSLGTMVATLDAAKAPCTVRAFLQLAQAKYFDDTPCHRETAGAEAGIFVLQCGDPTGTGSGGPGFTYKNENTEGVNYNRGVLAMANAGADTNGSQFFINYADPTADGASVLAGNYTVFGQITQGLDILDKITSPGVEGVAAAAPPRASRRSFPSRSASKRAGCCVEPAQNMAGRVGCLVRRPMRVR
ncbi:peptidylprolyl isomerase [Frankia nepalensis]|uniref:peptidylprolyl isomerase n=1 Tax=Frankia nepalensis TaxID=1836974 RepID=UPI0027DB298C|nr:peptidylprolyl isomerase [Frankia nepalensis]